MPENKKYVWKLLIYYIQLILSYNLSKITKSSEIRSKRSRALKFGKHADNSDVTKQETI